MKVYMGEYIKDYSSVQLDLFTNEPVEYPSRDIQVEIDPWDTWNMDDTLAHIILPMLKQLKETKHSSPYVSDEDVPDYLKKETEIVQGRLVFKTGVARKDIDENIHDRWEYVLNEMIYSFEHVINKWDDVGVYSTEKHNRVQNGLELFGKYFTALWD